jgi:hypothetical protein
VTGPEQALADELAELDRLPLYLTREETWTLLRMHEATLDRALERGELARRRVAGRTLIPRASVRAWILRQAGVDDPEEGGSVIELPAKVGAPKTPPEGSPT